MWVSLEGLPVGPELGTKLPPPALPGQAGGRIVAVPCPQQPHGPGIHTHMLAGHFLFVSCAPTQMAFGRQGPCRPPATGSPPTPATQCSRRRSGRPCGAVSGLRAHPRTSGMPHAFFASPPDILPETLQTVGDQKLPHRKDSLQAAGLVAARATVLFSEADVCAYQVKLPGHQVGTQPRWLVASNAPHPPKCTFFLHNF